MVDVGAGEKLKVFVSYSRKDSATFADELVAGLKLAGFAPFLDRHDIAAGEDWEARLGGLIAQSDTVIFVVSPEAVKSERCTWEVDRTIELSKRLLPVVFKRVPEQDIPEKLRRLQFVGFDGGAGFARPLSQLAEALRVDLDWIREHTRLGELARRWEARARQESLLLRGDALDAAKAWIASRKAEAPEITEAQRAFVRASEEAEATRLGKERAHLRRTAQLLWIIASLVLLWFGYVLWKDYDVARRELAIFTSLTDKALKDERFDRAMRYALQAYPARGRLPWMTPFSAELEGKLAGAAQFTRLRLLLHGHSAAVKSAAFSGDGKRVVTASKDNTARIWDAESGDKITVLKGHANWVLSAEYSGDGKRVVTASRDKTARIWDAENGREIAVLKGHNDTVNGAAFSGDGKRVVTASYDETARIWDAENGKQVAVLKHAGPVHSAAFSGDGKRVMTASDDNATHIRAKSGSEITVGSGDDTAHIWDVETGREIAVLKRYIAFSGDGKRAVTRSDGNTARIWDAESGNEIAVLKDTNTVMTAAFSGDSKRVVTASRDRTVRIWDAESGRDIQRFEMLETHATFTNKVAFSGDGKRVVTASDDPTGRLWDAESGWDIAVLEGHGDPINTVAFSSDGKRVVTASDDHTARIWDVEKGKEIAILKGHHGFVYGAVPNRDGKRVVTTSEDNAARIWDAESGKEIRVLKDINDAAFSGDGKRVVTASKDNTARIWDAESGDEITVLKGHADLVLGAKFSGDSKQVVTASRDKTARIWDAENGRETIVLNHAASVIGAAFTRDGKRVVTGSEDNTTRIWDVESGQKIAVLKYAGSLLDLEEFSGDSNRVRVITRDGDNERIWDVAAGMEIAVLKYVEPVNRAAFSGDGKRVVTTSNDNIARIWDAEKGSQVAVLKGHSGRVNSAAFSGDGKRVVTASSDNTARIWDAESGSEIAVLKGSFTSPVVSARFSPDGTRAVTGSYQMAHMWDVSWTTLVRGDSLRERVCVEKLIGAAQEFTEQEIEDPIFRGIDINDTLARKPCLRRGPLSLDYWTRVPGQLWRSMRRLAGIN
jgi:WD40 repeat protein